MDRIIITIWLALSTAVMAHGAEHGAQQAEQSVSPHDALKRLQDGNARFVSGESQHPHEAREWRSILEGGQRPFAVVLGCSDSRVPPELLFDQGFGDLFIVRVAGNVVDTDVIASIEYAVDHLDTRLVVVMGHSNCGAVTATLDELTDPGPEAAEIVSLLYRIEPAVVGLPDGSSRDEKITEAVKRNVELAVRRLTRVPDLRRSMDAGRITVVGAVYDMHTGRVGFLEEPTPRTHR